MKKTIEEKLKQVGDFSILVTEESRKEVAKFMIDLFGILKINNRIWNSGAYYCCQNLEFNADAHVPFGKLLTLPEAKQLFYEDELGFPRMMLVSKDNKHWDERKVVSTFINEDGRTVYVYLPVHSSVDYYQSFLVLITTFSKELPQKTKIPTSELIQLGKQAYASQNNIEAENIEEVKTMKKTSKEYVRKNLKPEFLKKLDELGVFDEWYENSVIMRGEEITLGNDISNFNSFILFSFRWRETKEGHDFWEEISKK